jgi:hypothetical protein
MIMYAQKRIKHNTFGCILLFKTVRRIFFVLILVIIILYF